MVALPVVLTRKEIGEFCARNHIRKLSLFGSVLTRRFHADSDIDVLVEFEPGNVPGYFDFVEMELELSAMLGRKADLRAAEELSRHFRNEVVASAAVQYEQLRPGAVRSDYQGPDQSRAIGEACSRQ
jgi:predicted nucleotidyltransferase